MHRDSECLTRAVTTAEWLERGYVYNMQRSLGSILGWSARKTMYQQMIGQKYMHAASCSF
jgi:hypothetical protein